MAEAKKKVAPKKKAAPKKRELPPKGSAEYKALVLKGEIKE